MTKRANKAVPILDELKNVASTNDVDALDAKVSRCYSQDKYEEFLEAVEKIILRYLKGKIGWAVLLWLITLIGSMLLQKFFRTEPLSLAASEG